MKIKRISFIEAKSPGNHIFSKFPIPRVGTILLSTILRDRGYEVKAFIEDVGRPDWAFVESSDIVCISTLTSTAPRAYKIAERVKARGIPVLMGGAHTTFMPEEALVYADYVLRGEADDSITELFDYIEHGKPSINNISGLSYKDTAGNFQHNPDSSRIKDLDSLPIPDVKLVQEWDRMRIYPISTSRGCPFDCKFCSVIRVFGRQYRFNSVEHSLREIKHACTNNKTNIFFVDDNFSANKKHTKELLKAVIAEGIKPFWSAQVRTDVAKDEELLRLFADSGCHMLYIGFESINPVTLESYNKGQSLDEIVRCIKTVQAHGIQIHGMFVLGADTDDVDTIRKTADFAINLGIDTVQFMILTPLPGTPFFFEMQHSGRLLHTDWSKYDAHHVNFKPTLMKPQTLHIETFKAMGRFYSWKYIAKHVAKLDFFHVAVGFYGKQAVKQALDEAKDYFASLSSVLDCPEAHATI
ncbi:B12-binding domain-containing radical SAM protein [Candidatus Magnetominusculus xianensis]|uniref:B12-binding domain-containing radical SAM protein n=1 Tax=Candidatus Magnetominusculus xianensis TaxID=1748249 RepID=A0ABR5SCK6_9BACT|nr:radical SAM protein [Candidatus Magnetominusculus xianensis]KWT75939.1 B12-binding domain-containing radical SAM protein [Candidatus Magnetominusculus xianensis]MBF0405033.1 radical SAM protein [Nitrospirota bacterium]